ncbi:hypothetical protein C1H46_039015 [Malus baccata]|uniref:Uncharacterized protein n=1 Tax=Malus baccata TaxID=106549 RepID=A0A540KML4_MALBA|nr:hypothetical protein C1H46_039015 [Malus baccata]
MPSTHHRLYEFAKAALTRIFVHPYAMVYLRPRNINICILRGILKVCELYCGGGVDAEKWDDAQIGHYIGIELTMAVLAVGIGRE